MNVTMKKLFAYFKNYKWQSLLGPLFKLFEATFELLVPFVVGLIVDIGLGEKVNGAYPNADGGYIALLCGVLALLGLLGFAFSVTAQYFCARVATGVAGDIRSDLFKKIQSLSYKDIDNLGTATLLTRMTSDVDRFQSGVNLALRLFLRSPFIVFGAMLTAFFIDKNSIGVFALTILILAVIVYAVTFICMPLYKKAQAKLDKVSLSTRENLTGARVVRAFCQEEQERVLFDTRNEELTKSRKFVGVLASLTNPLTFVVINLATIVLIYTGALRVEIGELSQGSVLALYNLMGQILIELIKLANLIVTVTKAAACGGRIADVLEMQPSLQTQTDDQQTDEERYLVFNGVTARYIDGADAALENISFTLKKGETLGVIGGTGSGKTTLVNLIPHFYDIERGEIFVNGKNVKNEEMQTYLRERVGIVPQKARLFKGTLRENLLWGKADATDSQLWQALEIAQAKEFVEEKGGLDIPVEQGGKNFSGGQKQRLTIARALVRDPDLLILDDSSSALDYATDAALRKGVRGLKTTCIIVSQRASSVMHADKILVLDDGKCVGAGKHEDLLKNCEVYREIYDSQYKNKGEDAV